MRASTFLDLMKALQDGGEIAFHSESDIEKKLCFQRGWDLGRCLASFGTTLRVLQTAEAIERVGMPVM